MIKNKILHTFVFVFLAVTTFVLAASTEKPQCEVRELNHRDSKEIAEVMSLVAAKDVSQWVGLSDCDLRDGETIFICKSVTDQKVAGILKLATNPGKLQHLFGYAEFGVIAVHKDYRKRSVASLLMKHAESYCASKNIKRIGLCVDDRNAAAVKCYSKYGFYRSWDSKVFDAIIALSAFQLSRNGIISMVKKLD